MTVADMTVAELVERLSKLDQSLPVKVVGQGSAEGFFVTPTKIGVLLSSPDGEDGMAYEEFADDYREEGEPEPRKVVVIF